MSSSEENKTCQRCQNPIVDQYLLRVGEGVWHEHCVKCETCGMQLFDRCYERDGILYCKTHYYRIFSPYKCCGCKEGISPTDMVYKLKTGILYHISCHRCYHCGKTLCPGEQIVVDDNTKAVSCVDHYEQILSADGRNLDVRHGAMSEPIQQTPVPPTFPLHDSISPGIQGGGLSYVQLDASGSYTAYMGAGDDYSCSLAAQKYLKRRGPRTTIKQNQLDVLNRIFNATPKPSKHARAKLALETGLSMRVIQVWFQNRRSKERRLKHLCNWIRENENRGLIPPLSPMGGGSITPGGSTMSLPPAGEVLAPGELDMQQDDDDQHSSICSDSDDYTQGFPIKITYVIANASDLDDSLRS